MSERESNVMKQCPKVKVAAKEGKWQKNIENGRIIVLSIMGKILTNRRAESYSKSFLIFSLEILNYVLYLLYPEQFFII